MSRGDFWSRRRAQVAEEQASEEAAARAVEEHAAADEIAEKTDAEILQEFELPDPDTLEMGDDVTGFMNKAVPERLRRRALRKLWRLNPVLANLDGLNDYDGDFTNAATDAPGVATSYRVGKGLLRHIEAMEAKANAAMAKLPDDGDLGEVADVPENTALTSVRPPNRPQRPLKRLGISKGKRQVLRLRSQWSKARWIKTLTKILRPVRHPGACVLNLRPTHEQRGCQSYRHHVRR